jgi:hypothetical protein
MTTIKLTKTTVDCAAPQLKDYELRDTITPGPPADGNAGWQKSLHDPISDKCWAATKTCYRPLRGDHVEPTRWIAEDWLAEVGKGTDPSAERAIASLRTTPNPRTAGAPS